MRKMLAILSSMIPAWCYVMTGSYIVATTQVFSIYIPKINIIGLVHLISNKIYEIFKIIKLVVMWVVKLVAE